MSRDLDPCAWHVEETPDPLWRFSLPSMFLAFAGGMALPLLQLSWNAHRPAWLRGPLARADLWIVLATALCALVGEQPESTDSAVLFLAFGILLVGACVLPLTPGPLVRALGRRPRTRRSRAPGPAR